MFLYLITNAVNGKRYVGITTRTVAKRWRGHCCAKKRQQTALQRAMCLYGQKAFSIEQIGIARDFEHLQEMERDAIISYGTLAADGNGYNETFGGIGFNGAHTPETRAKMSASRMGHKNSFGNTNARGSKRTPESIAKTVAGNIGRVHSPEEKAKRAASLRLVKRGPEFGAAISAGKKGKSIKPLSPESRAKLSASLKGRVFSPETIEKMRAAAKGRSISPEARAKMSATRKGRIASPETRAKISAGLVAAAAAKRAMQTQQKEAA